MVLMVDLTAKDGLPMFLSRHVGFCALGVNGHDDLIGPLFLLYVDVFLDHDDASSVKLI